MSDRKLKKFCRIMPWVQAADPKLADAIQDLCMEGQLSSRFGGVTFLYPGKEVRAEIVKKAYSDDADAAMDLIRAHIIPAGLGTASAFSGPKVGSKLGVKLAVKSASGSKVTLDNGAVLEQAASFKPLRNEKIFVWEVKSGAVPTTGEKFEWKRGGCDVSGGAEPQGNALRQQIAADVEGEFKTAMSQTAKAARIDECYLKSVASLYEYLCNGQHAADAAKALSVIDADPVATFYILVEPYKTSGDYFISDEAISGWGGSKKGVIPEPASEVLALYTNLKSIASGAATTDADGNATKALIFENPQAVFDAARQMAQRALSEVSAQIVSQITQEYQAAVSANRLGELSGVWPNEVAQALAPRKLWQDILRWGVKIVTQRLHNRDASQDIAADWDTFESLVRQRFPGNDYGGEVSNMCGTAIDGGVACVDRGARIGLFSDFISSTDFMYLPMPAELTAGFKGGDPDDNPLVRRPVNTSAPPLRRLQAASAEEKAAGKSQYKSFQ